MPLLQIRREGLQCYTLMSTSHTRELTAKGGSTPPLSCDQESKKKYGASVLRASGHPEFRNKLGPKLEGIMNRFFGSLKVFYKFYNSELLNSGSVEY